MTMTTSKIFLGLHDNADIAPKWVDTRSSYTWLRAFERIDGARAIAYLKEKNYQYDVEGACNGVFYRFRTGRVEGWIDGIVNERPDVILHNICMYFEAGIPLQVLIEAMPHTLHVVRIHHQVNYLAAQPGFRDFLLSCDVAIAPTAEQIKDVKRLGFTGPIYSIPFGINAAAIQNEARHFDQRDIQLISATNDHPARNLGVVEAVYSRLRERGRTVENVIGLSPQDLARKLGRSKIFWQTSLTEASGSRILPEAIAAGCYPVVLRECQTTNDFLVLHATGSSIESGIQYDYASKTTTVPSDAADKIADTLDKLISRFESDSSYKAPNLRPEYLESHEIETLTGILMQAVGREPDLRYLERRWLDLPVDEGEYAFNPAVANVAGGMLCIYRHVGRDGIRTLRRCILKADRNIGEVFDWSLELNQLGSDIKWQADPRLFQFQGKMFVCFNTGSFEAQNDNYIVHVGPNGRPLSKAIRLKKVDGRRAIEKNWGFFEREDKLMAIYSVSPFVVVEIDIREGVDEAEAKVVATREWDASAFEGQFGELHGGASPIVIGSSAYYVVQSNTMNKDGLIYRGSLVKFDLPSLRPLAYAEQPIFRLSVEECRTVPEQPLNSRLALCLYPTGAAAIDDNERLCIFYGVNDYRAACRTYSIGQLEQRLVPIAVAEPALEAEPEREARPDARDPAKRRSPNWVASFFSKRR